MTVATDERATLCFLHGWGFDYRVLGSFTERFVPEWKVKALVLPGYDGTPPQAMGIGNIARAMIPEVPDNSILIGWSLGGMIGIRIAAMKPVRKLILLASTPCFVKKRDWLYGTDAEVIEGLKRRIKIDPGRALREFAMLISGGDSRPRATYQALVLLLQENKAHADALLDGLDILLHADLRAEFSGLKCKASVILAAQDPLVPVAAGSVMLSLHAGMESAVIYGAGHAPFMSRPEQTRQMLLAMVERI